MSRIVYGAPDRVTEGVNPVQAATGADEVIPVPGAHPLDALVRSTEPIADVYGAPVLPHPVTQCPTAHSPSREGLSRLPHARVRCVHWRSHDRPRGHLRNRRPGDCRASCR